jgi:TRAP-type C4-dicarboxylate transport system substrate-binding protein
VGTFEALGAIPTPLPWGDLYSALQQGVVDAADSTVVWYDAYKFYEVAPNFTFSNHVLGAGIFLASAKWLSSLPEEDQKLVRTIARESAQHHRKIEAEASDEARNRVAGKGASFHEIELAPLVDATRKVHEANAESIGKEVIQRLADLKL